MEPIPNKPPRHLSPLSRLTILSGGIFSQVGWAVFGFGMFFFWLFVMNSEWAKSSSWGTLEPHTGRVTSVSPTSLLENKQPVYEYGYTYTVDGNTYEGESYLSEKSFHEGQEVTILYRPGKPSVSRIEGTRSAPFNKWVISLLLLPLVGLALILYGFRKNMKSIDLLAYGLFIEGKLMAKEMTNVRVNNRPVYAYTFEFDASDGKTYQTTGRTHHPHLLQEEKAQSIVYAQADPSYSVLFETIPFAPRINDKGDFLPISKMNTWVLILPILTVLGNIGYMLYLYK